MIISFTGTRNGLTKAQAKSFAKLLYELGAQVFIHGDCIGADANAHAIALNMGADIIKHPANIIKFRAFTKGGSVASQPRPPLERNKKIVDDGEYLIACPGTYEEELRSGTWSTVRYARRIKKPRLIIWPDGKVSLDN